jgi:hypothetical protein
VVTGEPVNVLHWTELHQHGSLPLPKSAPEMGGVDGNHWVNALVSPGRRPHVVEDAVGIHLLD